MMPDFGSFVVSLDFELMWGILDQDDPLKYGDNIKGVRNALPQILKLFEQYGIHATWGVVGMLTYDSLEELKKDFPINRPDYCNCELSPYNKIEMLKDIDSIYLFAPDLLKRIAETKNQEIASHTYSHYYCVEKGQTEKEFEDDIVKALSVTVPFKGEIDSLIFPRNQFNTKYSQVLKRNGIKNYRGTEKMSIYQSVDSKGDKSLTRRALRLMDAYINISGHNTYGYDKIKDDNGLNNISSSRFLRPYNKKLSLIEPLKIRRIKKQMKYAAEHKRVFHLWWHPHNFGCDTEKNIENLRSILDYYKELEREYGMRSFSMREVGILAV